jgi:hypothetical protein
LLLNPGDLSVKLRDLEVQIIDMKSQMERRFVKISEEMPSRLEQEVKRLEARGNESYR